MKKLMLLLLSAPVMYAEDTQPTQPATEEHQTVQPMPEASNGSIVNFEAFFKRAQESSLKTYQAIVESPASHAVAAVVGFGAAALVCRRLSGVARLHSKVDELLRLSKKQTH